jgi:predicted DNA-binding transcriptional regulator YafY
MRTSLGGMNTSARMLRLLSLLQTHRYWPGGELAGRLEVSPRTLRRDVDRLRELGYVVDAVRGVAGGYQLRAGGQLPPLLLEDEEAVAIAVSLQSSAAGGTPGMEETAVQALSKVIALMSPRLRRQMDALRSQTERLPWSGGPALDPGLLSTLAQACRDCEPLHFTYTAPPRDGRSAETTDRWVEPHRMVSMGRRWYLVAYDRDRQDWRSFRVDRISEPRTTGQTFRQRELPAADALSFVQSGIRRMPQRYAVRIVFDADPADVTAVAGHWAAVSGTPGRAVLEMNVDTLEWPMFMLANVDADFTVESPPELVTVVGAAAARFGRSGPARAHPDV